MDKDTQNFTPELVDGQIDQLLANRSLISQEKRVVDDLQQMFQDNERSLKSVWQRLGLESDLEASAKRQQGTLHADGGKPSINTKVLAIEKDRPMSQSRKSPWMRTLSLIAAACVAILIVGSLLIVTNLAHQSKNSTGTAGQKANQKTNVTLPPGVYISSQDAIYRLDAATHQVLWQHSLSGITKIVPAGNTVYILQSRVTQAGIGNTSAVVALDANSGKVLWTHVFKKPAKEDVVDNPTSMVLFQNRLYVSLNFDLLATPSGASPVPTAGEVDVLSATQGKLQTAYTGFGSVDDLAVSSDGLLAVSSNLSLQVYNLASTSKTPLWQHPIQMSSLVGSLSFTNGLLYTINSANTDLASQEQSFITSYQAKSGVQAWKSPAFADALIEGFTVDQGTVYFGTLIMQNQSWTGSVYAYDTQANKHLWSLTGLGGVQVAPIVSNGLVYVTADSLSNGQAASAHVVALAVTNGMIKWQQKLTNDLADSICLSNGVLYATNSSASSTVSTPNGLYALDATGGNMLWENTQVGSPTHVVPTA